MLLPTMSQAFGTWAAAAKQARCRTKSHHLALNRTKSQRFCSCYFKPKELRFVQQRPGDIMARVAVENRIVKVQKRNRALVRFDAARIFKAIMRAADSIGGFKQDHLPGINDKVFEAWPAKDSIAGFLTDAVVMLLNSNPH